MSYAGAIARSHLSSLLYSMWSPPKVIPSYIVSPRAIATPLRKSSVGGGGNAMTRAALCAMSVTSGLYCTMSVSVPIARRHSCCSSVSAGRPSGGACSSTSESMSSDDLNGDTIPLSPALTSSRAMSSCIFVGTASVIALVLKHRRIDTP